MNRATILAALASSTLFVISTCAHAISTRDVPWGTRQHCHGRVVLKGADGDPTLPVIHVGPNAGCTLALGGALIGGPANVGDKVLAACPVGSVCDFNAVIGDDYEGVLVSKARRVP
jgi:hypothetical protein